MIARLATSKNEIIAFIFLYTSPVLADFMFTCMDIFFNAMQFLWHIHCAYLAFRLITHLLIHIALKIAHRPYVIYEYNDHPAKTITVNVDAFKV